MIFINKVKLNNFRNYENEFEMSFDETSLILIYGRNGCGKSSIFSAIYYCLYGRGPNGETSSSLINKNTQKNMYVEVEISIGEDNYVIGRYYKTEKSPTSTKVEITKNSEHIEETTVDLNNTLIENLIMPSKIFTTTVLFSQESKHVMSSGADSDKKEIFDMILHSSELRDKLNMVKNVSSDLNRDLNRLEGSSLEAVSEAANNELIYLNNSISEIENKINLYEDEIQKNSLLIVNFDIEEKKYNDMVSLIETIKNDIWNMQTELSNIEQVHKNFLNEHNKDSKIKEYNIKFNNEYNLKVENLKLDLNKKNSEKEYEIRSKINNMENNISVISNKQVNNKTKFENEISNINAKILTYKNQLSSDEKNFNKEIKSLEHERDVVNVNEINNLKNILEKSHISCPNCGTDIMMNKENSENNIKRIKYLENRYHEINNEINLKTENFKKYSYDLSQEINMLIYSKKDIEENFKKTSDELEKEYKNLKEQYDEQTSLINNFLGEFDILLNKEISKLHEKYQEIYNKEIKELSDNIDKILSEESEKYNEDLKILHKITEKKDELNNKETELKLLNETLEILKNVKSEIRSFENLKVSQENALIDIKSRVIEVEKRIEEINNQMNEREVKKLEIKTDLNILEFWKEGFGNKGIKNMLLDSFIPFLNSKSEEYSLILSDGELSVQFTTLKELKSGEFRESFDLVISKTGYSDKFEYKELSGGQQRIVDLIAMFSIEDLINQLNSVDVNIVMYDEVFGALDEEARMRVETLLSQKKQQKCIILISHFDLPMEFDQRILIDTENS